MVLVVLNQVTLLQLGLANSIPYNVSLVGIYSLVITFCTKHYQYFLYSKPHKNETKNNSVLLMSDRGPDFVP
ncbi:hypothetical protein AM10699_39450 [Acaryochloris marina MBIC10699]|nr:hypothetical protein AM10699_39450 [Acaryochloris marina MBIC10699]